MKHSLDVSQLTEYLDDDIRKLHLGLSIFDIL